MLVCLFSFTCFSNPLRLSAMKWKSGICRITRNTSSQCDSVSYDNSTLISKIVSGRHHRFRLVKISSRQMRSSWAIDTICWNSTSKSSSTKSNMSRSRSSGRYYWTRGILIALSWKKSTLMSGISATIPNGKFLGKETSNKCKAARWNPSLCIASESSKVRLRKATSRSASRSLLNCTCPCRINSLTIVYIRTFNYLIYHQKYQRWIHRYRKTNDRRNSLNTWTICSLSLTSGNRIVLDSFSRSLIRKWQSSRKYNQRETLQGSREEDLLSRSIDSHIWW